MLNEALKIRLDTYAMLWHWQWKRMQTDLIRGRLKDKQLVDAKTKRKGERGTYIAGKSWCVQSPNNGHPTTSAFQLPLSLSPSLSLFFSETKQDK